MAIISACLFFAGVTETERSKYQVYTTPKNMQRYTIQYEKGNLFSMANVQAKLLLMIKRE